MFRSNEILWVLLLTIPSIVAVVHAVRTPASTWITSEQSPTPWVVLCLLVPVVGPLLYAVIAMPKLARAKT